MHECYENTVIYLHKASIPFRKKKPLTLSLLQVKFSMMMKNKYLIYTHFAQFADIDFLQNFNHCSG